MKFFKLFLMAASLITSLYAFSQDAVLEELVVTAQKTESSIMDTAAAITAISGEGLNASRTTNIEGLALISPDLVVAGEGKSRMNVRIRGVGSYAFDIATDPGVIMVIDGVAQPRISTMTQDFNDIERLEVLKGPQGAIYGTNALGGIINIVSKKATQEQKAKLSISAGNMGMVRSNLMLQGGITDSISARFNVQRSTDDGTMVETTYGNNNGADVHTAKFQLYGEADNSEWNASLSHALLTQDAVLSEPVFLCNSTNPILNYAITPAKASNGTDLCATLAPASSFQVRGDLNMNNLIVKDSIANPRAQKLNTDGFNFTETMNFGFNYKMDLDNLSLTAILGFQKANSGEMRDFDSAAFDTMNQSHAAETETTTFELRLDSVTEGGIAWSAGVYAMLDEGTRLDNFSTGADSASHAFKIGGDVKTVNEKNGTTLDPTTNPADMLSVLEALQACITNDNCPAYASPIAPAPRGTNYNATDLSVLQMALAGERFDNIATVTIDTEVTAIFGSIKFPLTEDISLLLAGRYTDHQKPYIYDGATNAIGAILLPAPFNVSKTIEAEEFTPLATLEYVFGDSLAWVTYSNGYKIGSPSFAQWNATIASTPSGDEELTMLEAGYKTILGNGSQLELIVYDYDYDNKQNLLVAMGATGPYGKLVNGDATLKGLDFAYRTLLGPSTKLSFAYAYIDSKWDRFMDDASYAAPGKDLSGTQLPFTAENNLSLSLDHTQATDLGEITHTVSYAFKDKYYLGSELYPGINDVDPYSILNYNLTLATNEGYDVSLFCKNCLDEQYFNVSLNLPRAGGGGARNQLAMGRMIGAQITSEF